MRIAMLTENPLFFGGGEIHAYELSKRLARLGHEIDFIQMYGKPRKRSLKVNEELSPSISFIRSHTKIGHALISRALWVYSFITIPFIVREIKRGNYDVVHVHGFSYAAPLMAAAFAKKSAMKIVCTLHNNLLSPLERTLLRMCFSKVEVFISVSHSMQIDWFRFSGRKAIWIPNGVDLTRFNPNNDGSFIRGKYGLNQKFVILLLGRLSRQKGVEYLLKAVPYLTQDMKDFIILICGEGEQEEQLKKLTKELNIAEYVKFAGHLQSELVPLAYAACDLFVLPSIFETFAITLLEAMATGKPVIATSVGGVPETITFFNEFRHEIIVPPRSSKKLAEAILWYYKFLKLRQVDQKVMNSRVHEEFSWDRIVEKTLRAYQRSN